MLLGMHINVMDKKYLSSLQTCSYSVYPESSSSKQNIYVNLWALSFQTAWLVKLASLTHFGKSLVSFD